MASPPYGLRAGNSKPVARVLEARILPPSEGQNGLGANNAPGLSRLESATFTGEYPLAHIDFADHSLPVKVSLQAFSPFIPHEADESGLFLWRSCAIERVKNPGVTKASVSIAFSIDNPMKGQNQPLASDTLSGVIMNSPPELGAEDPMRGDFALCAINTSVELASTSGAAGHRAAGGIPQPAKVLGRIFPTTLTGCLPSPRHTTRLVCFPFSREALPPVHFGPISTFLLAWRFSNRTPDWCGWKAPKDQGKTVIGNHYCTRFPTALAAAEYTAANLNRLESQTRLFAQAFRASTLASCDQRSRKRQSLHTRQHRLLPHGGRRVPRLRRRE